MFFTKPETKNTLNPNPQAIGILGTSGLSFFLAAVLQKAGHNVHLLCPPKEADEFNATDFIFKDGHVLQNQRQTFRCDFEMSTSPALLLITSSAVRLRSDLLLLSKALLKNSLVVNFTPTEPANLIAEVLEHPVINAYFDGWLERDKNHISLLNSNNNITITFNEYTPQASFLRDVFADTGLGISASENAPANFWLWFAPRVAADLFSAATGKNVFSYGKTTDGRKQIDEAIREIIALAAADGTTLESAEILPKIYSIPTSYASPLTSAPTKTGLVYFERLNALLFRSVTPDDQRFPILRSLLRQIRNKL